MTDVWILSDGVGNQIWAVALDRACDGLSAKVGNVLKAVTQVRDPVQASLVVLPASLGSRQTLCPPALIESIRQVDEGRNIERHYFDVVHMRCNPQQIVLGIGRNQRLRSLASRLALACRMAFEVRIVELGSETVFMEWWEAADIELRIRSFNTQTPAASSAAEPMSLMDLPAELPATGVWAEPPVINEHLHEETTREHLSKRVSSSKNHNKIRRFNASASEE